MGETAYFGNIARQRELSQQGGGAIPTTYGPSYNDYQPRSNSIQPAIDIYTELGNQPTQGPAYVHPGWIPQERFQPTQSQITRPPDPRGQSGGGYTRSSAAPAETQRKPISAIPYPDQPKFKAPEYAPPPEDESLYMSKRQEFMGAGLRELREGTREAMLASQSLDNPNARAQFVQQALKGYGQGLERVSGGAGREALSYTGKKRAEELQIYNSKYAAKSQQALTNYQAEINSIANTYASQMQAQQWNAEAGVAGNGQVPFDPAKYSGVQGYGTGAASTHMAMVQRSKDRQMYGSY